ncbi:HDOD domain-containing protein [Acetitomaculum ruminis DSM 5522]|uniref:HDOD domain-containing protein n=1 Tax=Acetitomaculum ruminis DSM 5522 TaxID=1120918 RepID=A0A1I0ZYT5_9FIRM|nr:HD domain-containing phosphohydrolase [Acetitomaculum ruminis]SFB30864.1 HDOD domain-containing protein [Acetitomaculum ruminis DSM 5522]
MFELIRIHQLNIMLLLCGACAILTILLFMTRFLNGSRKRILILMELFALFLLWFDRAAYIYSGTLGQTSYIMVRLSNFMVFFLTSGVVFAFNMYLRDYLVNEGGLSLALLPYRLKVTRVFSLMGMLLAVISAFTGLYYYFDENNMYHRGPGFLIAYIIPIICPILQYTVIRQYKNIFSKVIYISMVLYIYVPIVCGILQIFVYGISIVNMAMVAVSISLYLFTYIDINNTVERAHEIEIRGMQGEKAKMQRLFDQTAKAFVSVVEKKDTSIEGCSVRVAECAKKIARLSGMNESECEKVYYAGLLHNIGMVGISDADVLTAVECPDKAPEIFAPLPIIGNEILSNIRELPYLARVAYCCHENYDGTGQPEGLKGDDIPDFARIVAVADAYVLMKTASSFSRLLPDFVVKEALLKGAGERFDPKYAEIMIKIIDENSKEEEFDKKEVEKNLTCLEYRQQVSTGIPITDNITKITFECESLTDVEDNGFSAPSIILFAAYDRYVHDNEKSIEAYKYVEYGEIWFDDHSVRTEARRFKETIKRGDNETSVGDGTNYEICMGKYEDHLKLKMISPSYEKEVIVALSDGSRSAYLAITGEYCRIKDISIELTGVKVTQDDITRIVSITSYIDRMESDIKNLQIDRLRSAYTQGIELKDRLRVKFHTMSLPSASLVWHCPYFVVFYSEDGKVEGKNYREYGLVKIYGENDGDTDYAQNSITMKKTEEFPGWDEWKENNKKGMECEVLLRKKNNRIILKTCNFGIDMENVTTINDGVEKVYVALTGEQVAITDIRVR